MFYLTVLFSAAVVANDILFWVCCVSVLSEITDLFFLTLSLLIKLNDQNLIAVESKCSEHSV